MGKSERTFRSAWWVVPGRGGSMWGAAGDQGRLGREPRAPNRDPPRCSAFHTGSWFSTGLRLEGRLPGQTGLGTIAPVPVLDGAVLLGFADGCPLSGEKPVALVPLPSSRWVQGPPKSGTLSQAPPQGGKASSGLCMLPGVARVREVFCSGRGCGPGPQGDWRVCKGGSASHRVLLENAIPERL